MEHFFQGGRASRNFRGSFLSVKTVLSVSLTFIPIIKLNPFLALFTQSFRNSLRPSHSNNSSVSINTCSSLFFILSATFFQQLSSIHKYIFFLWFFFETLLRCSIFVLFLNRWNLRLCTGLELQSQQMRDCYFFWTETCIFCVCFCVYFTLTI